MILKELEAKAILNFTLFPRFLSFVGDRGRCGDESKTYEEKKNPLLFPLKFFEFLESQVSLSCEEEMDCYFYRICMMTHYMKAF